MKLDIIAVAVILLTFLFRQVLKDRLKDLQDRIAAAEVLFRTEINTTALQAQLTKAQMDVDDARSKWALAKAKRTQNFSVFIVKDRAALAGRRGELKQMEDITERLLKVLPHRKANLESFAPIKTKIEVAIETSMQTEKACESKKQDWSQTALLKVEIMKLAFLEIEVALYGGEVLKKAVKVREAAETLYNTCNWIGYFLYVVGFGIAVYAHFAGIKTMIGLGGE